MTERLILEKLDNLEKQSNKLDSKVDKIEVAVGLIAVQSERINNMQIQLQALWEKYNEAFDSNGVISVVKQFQASCPRDEIKIAINRQWIAIGILATAVSGGLLRAFKIL